MCIIIVVKNKTTFKEEYIDNAAENNPDGIGAAWVESGKVWFAKGLTKESVKKLLRTKNTPILLHFRLATHGRVCKELCHPFPLDVRLLSKNKLYGYVDSVLMHNGTEHRFKDLQDYLKTKAIHDENMSDTKALAYFLALHKKDYDLLKLFSGKFAILEKTGNVLLFGDFIEDDGNYYSNTSYKYSYKNYYKNFYDDIKTNYNKNYNRYYNYNYYNYY
jgi:predicted glutamine amidotransferase